MSPRKFVSDFNERTGNTVQYLEAPYEPNEYRKLVRGLEEEPEGGDRCKVALTTAWIKQRKWLWI